MIEAGGPEEVLAIPIEPAARLASASVRQVRYWDEIGLVVPSIKRTLSPRNTVRLYGFADLVELVAVAKLRHEPRVSLLQIRRIVGYLRDRTHGTPLREIRFAAHTGEVFFELPDGTWSGGRDPGQIVIHRVLDLDQIRTYVLEHAGRRDHRDAGRIVRRRRVHGAKPVFAGTRVPVAAVSAYLARGYSDQQVLDAFPALTTADIDAAREHSGAA